MGCRSLVRDSGDMSLTNTPQAPISRETAASVPTISPRSTVTAVVPSPTSIVQEMVSTSTPEISQEQSATQIKTCSTGPVVYDFDNLFDIRLMTALDFADDDTIYVEGWDSSTDFQTGTLSLTDESVEIHDRTWIPISAPCTDDCSFSVLDQSPNGKWQLLLAKLSPDRANGLWLVGENYQAHLVEFIPVWSRWQWSEDGSVMWLEYSEREFGAPSVVIQLEPEPVIYHSDLSQDNPLQTTWYYVAFSPRDNTAWSVRDPEYFDALSLDHRLYLFDFDHVISPQPAVETVENLVKVEWNQATYSTILILSYEDRIELVDRENDLTVRLLLSTFDDLLQDFVVRYNIPFDLHALSSSGDLVAITLGDGRVFVFECLEVI